MTQLTSIKATQEKKISIIHWTNKLFSFQITKPITYNFMPGQFARLGLLINNQLIWRAYSIASTPSEDILEFFVILIPDGIFTPILNQLQLNDLIWLDALSYGLMTTNRFINGEDFWMFASGTGLGPFISILQSSKVWSQFRHLVLVHCVRYTAELVVYQEKLQKLQKKANQLGLSAQLYLIQTTTRDYKVLSPNHLHGRITYLLYNKILENHVSLSINMMRSRLMICGNPNMIRDVRNILLKQYKLGPCRRNFSGQFITEGYW